MVRPADRQTVELGTLGLNEAPADPEKAQRPPAFDPVRLAHPAADAVSFGPRVN